MAIEITRQHALTKGEALRRLDLLAERLAGMLKGTYGWEGDRLFFGGRGVDGFIDVREDDVTVYINKSRLLPIPESVIRQQIEAQIDAFLS